MYKGTITVYHLMTETTNDLTILEDTPQLFNLSTQNIGFILLIVILSCSEDLLQSRNNLIGLHYNCLKNKSNFIGICLKNFIHS